MLFHDARAPEAVCRREQWGEAVLPGEKLGPAPKGKEARELAGLCVCVCVCVWFFWPPPRHMEVPRARDCIQAAAGATWDPLHWAGERTQGLHSDLGGCSQAPNPLHHSGNSRNALVLILSVTFRVVGSGRPSDSSEGQSLGSAVPGQRAEHHTLESLAHLREHGLPPGVTWVRLQPSSTQGWGPPPNSRCGLSITAWETTGSSSCRRISSRSRRLRHASRATWLICSPPVLLNKTTGDADSEGRMWLLLPQGHLTRPEPGGPAQCQQEANQLKTPQEPLAFPGACVPDRDPWKFAYTRSALNSL